MPDEADRAQALEQLYLQIALHNQRVRRAPLSAPRQCAAGRVCCDCEELIALERLQSMRHAVRCTACQTITESQ